MKRMLAGAALALLAGAGCGSGDKGTGVATLAGGDNPTPSASASPVTDPDEAFRRFARCMREHGVEMPDPGADGQVLLAPGDGAAPPQEFSAAEQACNVHLKAVLREGPKPNDPEMQDRALKFARCMRENGVDLPDPGADGSIQKAVPNGGAPGGKPPFESPEFKAAQRECEPLLKLTPEVRP